MAVRKRRMVLIPSVNPNSLVFFFEKGDHGGSWSIRDYSTRHKVAQYGPGDFRWTAEEILRQAEQVLDAPAHSTADLAFWHQYTQECNQRFGRVTGVIPPAPSPPVANISFPTLKLQHLMALPKGRKTQDMRRILHSPNSEDWVTWNFFQLLLSQFPTLWWEHLVNAARRRNSGLVVPFKDDEAPTVEFWTSVAAPEPYLAHRRTQSTSTKPLEGSSEIDIVLDHNQFLVFAEAKLGSDVSLRTTYDTQRNQIIRNIDCLLASAGSRTPLFWMFVRDQAPDRAYVQLMSSYHADPSLLIRDLPHRDPEVLRRIARNLTTLQWSDFRDLVCSPTADAETAAVQRELDRRIAI